MDVSPETKLNKQSTFSYNSFSGSSRLTDGSSDFTCDLNENHDLKHLPKGVSLKQLDSGSPDLLDRSPTRLRRETDENCSSRDTLTRVYALSITFAVGVTIALSLHIYLEGSLVFVKGVVVSDHERCTALGQRVLQDRGSSVDAAITAALCLGVVHPHASGVGGGGVMLVHDVHKNETRVINFQGTAPKTLKEEMLQNDSKLKAGLQVGVPGLLRGLHHAHSLYGSLSWEDVVTRAAAVAKEGFNVSFSLGEQLSQRFRDMFLPDGRALLPGSILRMSSLAAVLEAGLSDFYDGNISQEIEEEVRTNGGVLSRKDISDYSVQVEQPVECLYNESIIQVPPPQSAGEAFISALDLLEGLYLNNQTHHWDTEALKVALALASGLGDRKYNSSVAELFSDMLSKSQLEVLHHSLNSSNTSPPDSAVHSLQTGPMAGQVVVMGPDGLVVSFASSLSTPFGCGIITRSGVILNSLILDFSWPNKTRGHLFTKQRVHPGKRPLSSLMPTIVVPAWHKCGLYLALSSSGGTQSLITQVLISALSIHKEKNDSLSLRRLQPQPNRLPVDSEFPEESVQSVVQGILRSNDVITAITLPRLSDSFL
ncbi:glutathione hydrolase 7-like isoform X2 [Centropristis striata]|uniref:glutathione hydrolase 7-like isoform X2 n=1 Tax=Centropristis striata TaxID=184440 RepID=UPI0027E0AD15|nr:glutathione hydrolase 7-like isoform X2 [Centropristis striata]